MTATGVFLALAWAAIGILTLAMAGLLRQIRLIEAHTRHLPSHANLRDIMAFSDAIGPLLSGDSPAFLLLVDANCATCRELMPVLGPLSSRCTIIVGNIAGGVRNAPAGVSTLDSGIARNLAQAWGVRATPYLAVINRDLDVVDARPLGSVDDFRAYFDAALSSRSHEM